MKFLAALGNVRKKMEKMLDDFNGALPILKALGLSVTNFQINMGILPAIVATLKGSFDDMEPTKIRHLKEANSENKVLCLVLRALESAANMKKLLGQLMVEGIQVYVKLGLVPRVEIGFATAKDSISKLEMPERDALHKRADVAVESV